MFNKYWRELLALIVLLGITGGLFSEAVTYDFINLDDPYLVQNNATLLQPLSWRTLFTPVAGLYHPLTNLTYWIDAQVAGLTPRQFHLTNVAFHLFGVCGFFWFALSLSGSLLAACLLAAAFAWHPTHVESVAWISERKDVLSAAFFWWALWAHQTARRPWALALAALSLLAKPSGIILPAVILMIEWYKGGSWAASSRWLSKNRTYLVGFVLISVVAAAMAVIAQSAIRSPESLSTLERLARVPLQILFYVDKTLWPTGLQIMYSAEDLSLGLWSLVRVLSFFVLTLVAAGFSTGFRRDAQFGLVFFVVVLFPVLKIVPFGDESPVADRYLYISQMGLLWPYAKLLGSSFSLTRRLQPLVVLVAAFWVHASWERLADWENSITIWESLLRLRPDSKFAHENLGKHYIGLEQPRKALTHLTKGKTEGFENAQNQAFALLRLRRLGEAGRFLEQAERLAPADPKILTLRGNWLLDSGDLAGAEAYFRKSLEVSPQLLSELVRAEALTNLGVVAFRKDRFEECVQWQDLSLKALPGYGYAHHNRALCLLNMGRDAEAEQEYERTVRLAPQIAMAHNGLGVLAMKRGDVTAAERHFNNALAIDPSLDFARNNLEALKRLKLQP